MKRFLSFICAIMMLVSCMAYSVFAEEEPLPEQPTDELTNIAVNGMGYCSSEKNSSWTPPSSIINGLRNTDDWHGWEPKYPSVEPGQNTSLGFSGEYCGIKFLNKEYYEVYEIKVNAGLHNLFGGQNTKYVVEALVEGVWTEIAVFYDSQFQPQAYATYEEAMANDTSNYHIPADFSYTLETPVTTNNVRITINECAKNYPGGDILIFPYIYEVELIGKLGVTPDIDLPEGAVFSQNIGYHSLPEATSSAKFAHPFLAIDGDDKSPTAWKPSDLSAGQALTLNLPRAYNINKFVVNFGEIPVGTTPENYQFNIEAYINGAWTKVADGNSYDSENNTCITEYPITTVSTDKVRLVFPNALTSTPAVYEFEAHIEGERTYFLNTRFSELQKTSASKGNLSILGTPYASASHIPYSDVLYMNDGKTYNEANVWFPSTMDLPVHCGIVLDQIYSVDKIVVYCKEPAEMGDDVTAFDIKALVNGEYVTIAKGESYNKRTGYTTIYDLETPVQTNDIKIEFTRCGGTIPNILELEIYSSETGPAPFKGYDLGLDAPEISDYPEVQEPVTPDNPDDPDDPIDDESSSVESSEETSDETSDETTTVESSANEESSSNGSSDNNGDNSDKNDNKTGLIVGICISVAVVIAIAVCAVIVIKKKKDSK
ncbi:MAG: hypothetical protein J6B60_04845 [Clostridia bacterium]|nr:hypothetical protein [Clostridia bacterium]